MQAFILAAGQGSRLRPYTADKPKCMVPLAGTPLLHHQLECLSHFPQIESVSVIGGYKSEMIDAKGATVLHNPEFAWTNMVASLFSVSAEIDDKQDLLILYGDILFEKTVLARLLENHSQCAVVVDKDWLSLWKLRMDDPLSDAETLKINQQGLITELGQKPSDYDQIEGQYLGLIKISAKYVKAFKEFWQAISQQQLFEGHTKDNMFMTSFLQALIDSGWPVAAVSVKGGWLEVDTKEDLELYENLHDQGKLAQLIQI